MLTSGVVLVYVPASSGEGTGGGSGATPQITKTKIPGPSDDNYLWIGPNKKSYTSW